MNWNPHLIPQHIVFEPVELVNELDPSANQFPVDLLRRPTSIYVPSGMSEKQATDAVERGTPPQPTEPTTPPQ